MERKTKALRIVKRAPLCLVANKVADKLLLLASIAGLAIAIWFAATI